MCEYLGVSEGWVCAYLDVDEDTITFNNLKHSYLLHSCPVPP